MWKSGKKQANSDNSHDKDTPDSSEGRYGRMFEQSTLGMAICDETGKRRFVAMIFDLTVPGGMGGMETVREIRLLHREIPIFVTSGYADNSVMKNPVEYGFTASISKPFTIAELSEMLDNHLKTQK